MGGSLQSRICAVSWWMSSSMFSCPSLSSSGVGMMLGWSVMSSLEVLSMKWYPVVSLYRNWLFLRSTRAVLILTPALNVFSMLR